MLGFASDYDGTLDFHRGGGISMADRRAIQRFRGQGGIFGVSTGRCREGLRHKVDGAIELDFAVLMTGAVVLDAKGDILFERRIPRDVTKELIRRFNRRAFGMHLVAGDEYWHRAFFSPVRRAKGVFNIVSSLDAIPDPLYGVSFMTPTQRGAERLTQDINRDYGNVVAAHQNKNSVDVTPAGCSKASGLRVIREACGIDVMGAMGDSYNDVSMLQEADVAYTFVAAPERVRSVADALVESVGAALDDFAQHCE